jgi:long-chain acyl-CoA synthetase
LLTRSDHVAIRLDDFTLTHAELDDESARTAAYLKTQGIAPGDRVGLQCPNVPEFAIHYFGALRAGAVVVPMNPLLKAREIEHYLTDSGAKLVLNQDTPYAEHEPDHAIEERDPADTAVLLYTSGTTGSPKGAQLTHANLIRNVATAVEIFDLDETSVTLGALPFFHAFGQTCALNATIARRAKAEQPKLWGFSPKGCRAPHMRVTKQLSSSRSRAIASRRCVIGVAGPPSRSC